jgi:CRISPR-associated endoribonuclease Cas6
MNISFYAGEAAEPFIIGLFKNQEFSIGDKISKVQFRVNSIEKLPEPEWKPTMTFRTESPIIISKKETETSRNAKYLSPEEPGYGELLIKNLLTKYMAVMKQQNGISQSITFGNPAGTNFTLKGKPRSKVIKIKVGTPEETSLKGYLFDFEITAPVELIKMGFNSGFGEKNSLGFGSGEMIELNG